MLNNNIDIDDSVLINYFYYFWLGILRISIFIRVCLYYMCSFFIKFLNKIGEYLI